MILTIILYFITRLPFLINYPVYYDSFEYSRITHLHQTHQPIHTFYIITILFFKKIFFFLNINTTLVLISFIFGLLTILVWVKFVKLIDNEKIATLSSILILLFPYFFLINTNILYESELLFFQILSIYFFYNGLKKNNSIAVIMSGIFWGISQLIFIGNLFLLPIFLLINHQKKNQLKQIIIFLIFFIFTSTIVDLISLGTLNMIIDKYQSHMVDFVANNNNLLLLLFRIIRNIFFQSSAILSLPGLIVFILATFILIIKNKKFFHCLIIILLPVFILQQYWHAGLFGRLSVFLVFPASLIIVKNITNFKLYIIIVILISLTTINIAIKQTQTPPIYQYYSLLKNNYGKNNTAIITSDYNRFVYEQNKMNILNINGQTTNAIVENFIDQSLKQKNTVLIDSAALKYPYYQYDGNYYHILSMNNLGKPQIQINSNKYILSKYLQSPKNKEIYFMKIVYNYPYASN